MVVIYCSTFGLRYFYKVSALLLRNSSPLRTARKDNRKVILFCFCAVGPWRGKVNHFVVTCQLSDALVSKAHTPHSIATSLRDHTFPLCKLIALLVARMALLT